MGEGEGCKVGLCVCGREGNVDLEKVGGGSALGKKLFPYQFPRWVRIGKAYSKNRR